MKKARKGGSILIGVLIVVIILVLSFVAILSLYRFYTPRLIDAQTCHLSVVSRSSAQVGPFEASTHAIPLKCQTEQICFSMSGANCEEIANHQIYFLIFHFRLFFVLVLQTIK